MIKRILYLHGLDAVPKPEKVELLMKAGTILSPKLNYRAFKDDITLFNELADSIKIENITNIVGSSFGGYMGFYLSEFCKIPAVLFNPAISFKSLEVPVINAFSNTAKTIILGIRDDVINPIETEEFIKKHNYSNTKILKLDFEHQVSEEIFAIALNYL
ncbi:MAG: YqiA/YcfP family alpha/beta fold hydrolase [bacterium]